MSKLDNKGVPHQVLDMMRKFEMSWTTKQNEMVVKHNDLVAQIRAVNEILGQVVASTATELGNLKGAFEGHIGNVGQALHGIDYNVLALAEMVKEVIGQLTQVDALFQKTQGAALQVFANPTSEEAQTIFKECLKLTEAEVTSIRLDAEAWYKQLAASACSTVRTRLEKQREEDLKAEEEARQQAEAAAKIEADELEAKRVETELKTAHETERVISTSPTGGPGSDFPDGAEIWGG